ncbi:DUF4832 domain-containing protein [Streptomyces sp. NPDC087856]|uniref:DUF4832 domain-containing protein n=1 Tax=Streptomyces sp. NPDC087856 TaxID=3365811 RepID=UPI003826C92A
MSRPHTLSAALALILGLSLLVAPSTLGAQTLSSGPPIRPPAAATPDTSLTVHNLAGAPSPVDNPLKGFARFYQDGIDLNSGYPHSLIWSYFPLNSVMKDPDDCSVLDWSDVETRLKAIAAAGDQAAIRFYVEYPDGTPANGTPSCLDGKVAMRQDDYWNTTSPDYDDPDLMAAFTGFIKAFGARYDGDPRLGFIHLGLVGLWGEWHTWPYDTDNSDDTYPNLMPTEGHQTQLIQAFDHAFHKTQLELRYPYSGGAASTTAKVGYHDDSFCYVEDGKGMSLPPSMNGWDWGQLQAALTAGVENKWATQSMGGEVRPEIQTQLFADWPNGGGAVDNTKACIELEHATWMMNERGIDTYNPTDENVNTGVRLMGYDLTVPKAYFDRTTSGRAKIGVQIDNKGVAPFYYPWRVQLGLKDRHGRVVKTWNTDWDLRKVQPLKLRAFPEWGLGADPTYLDYGHREYFDKSVDLSGVPKGSYQVVMKVRNPLESLSPAAKKLRFGNAGQGADGWLDLGRMTVGAGRAKTVVPGRS